MLTIVMSMVVILLPQAAFAASWAGPGAAQPPRAAHTPMARQADGGGGGIGSCVVEPADDDGQWTIPASGPGVKVSGCDGRTGSVTVAMATVPTTRAGIVQWFTGDPLESTAVERSICVEGGDLRLCGRTNAYILAPAIMPGVAFTFTWTIDAAGFHWTFSQPGHPQDGLTSTWSSPATTDPLSLLIGTNGSIAGYGCQCEIRLDSLDFVPWEPPDVEEEEDPCPSWTPGFLCDAATSISDFVGPITDALGGVVNAVLGIGVSIVGAIGSMGEMLVGAIGAIATQIWEVFKIVILDPEEVGAWWDEFYADLEDSNAFTWVTGVQQELSAAIPTVEEGEIGGLCVYEGACLGSAVSNLGPAEPVVSIFMYAWAFVTLCHLFGQVVKTVRR